MTAECGRGNAHCSQARPPDLLALSAERDAWQRLSLARERASYERGRADGITEGRRLEAAATAAAWHRLAAPVLAGTPYAELETRRWGPGGRARFAVPRPGDHPGPPTPANYQGAAA